MKGFIFFAGFILFVGCGAGHSGPGRNGKSVGKAAPSQGDPLENQTAAIEDSDAGQDPGLEQQLLGVWENASCGERRYLRRIVFKEQGKFAAVDEVAPCPEHGKCVLSGILKWEGNWVGNERTIELELNPAEGTKRPEKIPSMFVVLRYNPLSIGERNDRFVCPYQKRK